MLFLEDLAKVVRDKEIFETFGSAKKKMNDIVNKIELTPSQSGFRFNYCFGSKLKFEGSLVKPDYLGEKIEELEGLRKELTFDADGGESKGNEVIKLNLSESSENEREVNMPNTFTFNSSEKEPRHAVDNIIVEELNESKHLSHDDESSQDEESDNARSPIKRINLLKASSSSPSVVSSQRTGNVFNLRSICGQSNAEKDQSSVFRPKRARLQSELESEESTPQMDPKLSHKSVEKDVAPSSPDVRMKRRRQDRDKPIPNNPNMLLGAVDTPKSISETSKESSGCCLKMNFCSNNGSESSPEPIRAYSPFESAYKIDPSKGSLKKYTEVEMRRFDRNFDIEKNEFKTEGLDTSQVSFETIFETIKELTNLAKMESEIPIMALVYMEKLMKKTGILINEHNWKRIVLITL